MRPCLGHLLACKWATCKCFCRKELILQAFDCLQVNPMQYCANTTRTLHAAKWAYDLKYCMTHLRTELYVIKSQISSSHTWPPHTLWPSIPLPQSCIIASPSCLGTSILLYLSRICLQLLLLGISKRRQTNATHMKSHPISLMRRPSFTCLDANYQHGSE